MHWKHLSPIIGEEADTTLAGENRLPCCIYISTERGGCTKTGDHYATL
jgi:hypothetical protein